MSTYTPIVVRMGDAPISLAYKTNLPTEERTLIYRDGGTLTPASWTQTKRANKLRHTPELLLTYILLYS
jgi:hypothetical protein